MAKKKIKKNDFEKNKHENDSEEILVSSEKMLNWNKVLGEQSEYVKKAIEPLLSWEWVLSATSHDSASENYIDSLKTKSEKDPDFVKQHIFKNYTVCRLYNMLTDYVFDEKSAVEKLKSMGIEGALHENKMDVFNDDYISRLDLKNKCAYETNWIDLKEKPETAFEKLLPQKEKQDWQGCFSETLLGTRYDPDPACFLIYSYKNFDGSYNNDIHFFQDIEKEQPLFSFQFGGDIDSAKEIIENTINHFASNINSLIFD